MRYTENKHLQSWHGFRIAHGSKVQTAIFTVLSLLIAGCDSATNSTAGNSETLSNAETLTVSNVLPTVDSTDDNVISVGNVRTIQVNGVVLSSLPDSIVSPPEASVELGRTLFWDPILSGNQDVACATCHLPEFGYADGRERSVGVGGVGAGPDRVPGQTDEVPRNAQSVINTVWNGINELGLFDRDSAPMFWDSRTQSLTSQALEPIKSAEEMRGDSFTEDEILIEVVERLNSISEYQTLFSAAYGDSNITIDNVAQALADFQSTLIANNTPFDRYLRGDTTAMSNAQLNGMQVFVQHDCSNCHSGPMFSDFETHVLGVQEANGLIEPDNGDGSFAFRTPSLRQLAFTAPYFHGGQESTLNDAIDFYDNNDDSDNPNVANNMLDPDFRNIPNLNNNEIDQIEAFLNALSDDGFNQSRPQSVPSGLPVGGSIE